MGYHRAGFTEIVGVDIKPQPHYPFTFLEPIRKCYRTVATCPSWADVQEILWWYKRDVSLLIVEVERLRASHAGPADAEAKAAAWDEIARRLDDAQEYGRKHHLRVGANVWHAILDDAIQLRAVDTGDAPTP